MTNDSYSSFNMELRILYIITRNVWDTINLHDYWILDHLAPYKHRMQQ